MVKICTKKTNLKKRSEKGNRRREKLLLFSYQYDKIMHWFKSNGYNYH